MGGALLVPGSLAIISASFSDDQRGRAIGTWSGFTAITAALGPVLGGWLVDNHSWQIPLPSEARSDLDEQRVMLAAAESPQGLESETMAHIEGAIDDAFVFGFRRIMLVSAGLALASALTALLWIEPQPRRQTTRQPSPSPRTASPESQTMGSTQNARKRQAPSPAQG